jgi:hypothetical protein
MEALQGELRRRDIFDKELDSHFYALHVLLILQDIWRRMVRDGREGPSERVGRWRQRRRCKGGRR